MSVFGWLCNPDHGFLGPNLACLVSCKAFATSPELAIRTPLAWPNSNDRFGRSILARPGPAPFVVPLTSPFHLLTSAALDDELLLRRRAPRAAAPPPRLRAPAAPPRRRTRRRRPPLPFPDPELGRCEAMEILGRCEARAVESRVVR